MSLLEIFKKKPKAEAPKGGKQKRAPKKVAAVANAGPACDLDALEKKFREDFLNKEVHPKKKALAEAILSGEVTVETVEKYGKARIAEMREKINWARKGLEKRCRTCGKI